MKSSKLTFSLTVSKAVSAVTVVDVIDVAVDDDLNLFTLTVLSGKPHLMCCSLFTNVSFL
jgi:hypothetical protein